VATVSCPYSSSELIKGFLSNLEEIYGLELPIVGVRIVLRVGLRNVTVVPAHYLPSSELAEVWDCLIASF